MLKKVIGILLVSSSLVLAQVNDNLNLFNEEQKQALVLKTDEIHEKTGIKIFVNTLIDGEGFQLTTPERAIILNITKGEDDKSKVQFKFTQDLNMEEKDEELNLLLDNLDQFAKNKEYGTYTIEALNGLDEILKEKTIEDIQMEPTFPYEKAVFIAMIFFILLTIGKIIIKIRGTKKRGIIVSKK